jgi:hypothetical protein
MVVIALIIGTVYVGGTAIMERSRVVSLLAKIKDLGTTARAFKTQYGYFPGDLPVAATLITANGGVAPACSYAAVAPVGDGLVNTETESTCALEHLVRAGMLNKVSLDAATGNFFIDSEFGGGRVSLWFNGATNENVVRVTALPCKIALEIDTKLDNPSPSPLAAGFVVGLDNTPALINTCTTDGANDPVATLLVRY